jgi:hypothetical protein
MHKEIVFENVHWSTVDAEDSTAGGITDIYQCFAALKFVLLVGNSDSHLYFQNGPWQLAAINALWHTQKRAFSAKFAHKFKLYKVEINDTCVEKHFIALNDFTGHTHYWSNFFTLRLSVHVFVLESRYCLAQHSDSVVRNYALQVYLQILW